LVEWSEATNPINNAQAKQVRQIGKDAGSREIWELGDSPALGTLKDAAGQSFQGHKFTQMFQSILRCPGTIQIQFDPQIAGAAQRTLSPPHVVLLLSHLYAITATTHSAGRRGSAVFHCTVRYSEARKAERRKTGHGLDRRRISHTKDEASVALKRDGATEMSND